MNLYVSFVSYRVFQEIVKVWVSIFWNKLKIWIKRANLDSHLLLIQSWPLIKLSKNSGQKEVYMEELLDIKKIENCLKLLFLVWDSKNWSEIWIQGI